MYSGYNEIRQRNPRDTCNILSFLTFAYTIPLFKKGYTGNLQEADIYEVPKSCNSKRCGDKTEKEWEHCNSVIKLLWKRFGVRFVLYTCIHLTWTLISNTTLQPFAMSKFIACFEQGQTQYSKQDAYYYGGIVVLLSFFRCIWIQNYYLLECMLGVQIRSSLTSLIYRKVLRLRLEQIEGSNMGNIVTILTKDIRTILYSMWILSDLVIGGIQFIFLSYLLYARIGPISLIVIAMLASAVLGQVILSQFILKVRLKVGKMADQRLQFTKEAISALKIIKMYTWEAFFQKRICEARKKETDANLKSWYLAYIIISLGTFVAKLAFPIFLLSYISFGYVLNVELVYYVMSLFKEIIFVVGIILPSGLSARSECYASIIRIEKVMNMEEQSDSKNVEIPFNQEKGYNPKIVFQNVTIVIENSTILKTFSLTLDEYGLYVITGPLGSGKSSFLKAILKEYNISKGQLDITGSISYAAQDPWLFPATVKQNILFGQRFDQERYDYVVNICSLDYDFEVLPHGDNTIVTDGGLNLSKGQQARVNLARAVYKNADIYLLDDPLAGLDVNVQINIFMRCIEHFLQDKIVLFVTQDFNHLKCAKKVIELDNGKIKSIAEPDKYCNKLENEFSEGALGLEKTLLLTNELNNTKFIKNEDRLGNLYHEDKAIGKVEFENYLRHIKYGGGFLVFSVVVLAFFIVQFTESLSEKLISKWVDNQQYTLNKSANFNESNFDNQQYTLNKSANFNDSNFQNNVDVYENLAGVKDSTFYLYLFIIGFSACIDLVKAYIFLAYCRRSSVKFHQVMCQSVINCVMPFLDNHFTGNILNRFSYDLDYIDEVFPALLIYVLKSFFAICGTLILIISVNWVFLFIAILFFATLALIRKFFIPTGRAIKRLVAITRSPFIGHLNASIDGLSTIRAFKAESLLKDEFDKHQDLAISAAFMEVTTQRAFGYALDLDCAVFVTLVIFTFLFLDTGTSVGNIGLALTQVFSLSENLQWIIRAWTELEQCMTSVERVVEYTNIPQEDKSSNMTLDLFKKGKIDYQDVNLVYNFECKVLKNISFTINAGEKIGIVGRTGAGKSSIVSTLFRLYEYQGTIFIDDLNITEIPLESLRRNLSIIPQDPIIFDGSVRANIDPNQLYPDQDIWNVLRKVKMEKIITNLDTSIRDLTLSFGQKQLLCMARALLQNNKIVVMDEPTANLDSETDTLISNLIKENFGCCTILMIAHRLNSVLDCDKIMVMVNGNISEFDEPKNLLANKNSLFYQMIKNVRGK